MLDILGITTPVYLVIAAGYLCTRWGLFAKAEMRILGRFVLYIALPALLFNALAQRPLREVMHADYLLAYALGSLSVLFLAYLGAWLLGIKRASEQSYFAMGMCCSNSGYMGYPIALLLIGPKAGVALALNMLVENLLMLPLLLALAERGSVHAAGRARALGKALLQLVRTPMIAAILLGFVWSSLGLTLPTPLAHTVTLLAQGTAGVALFVIGAALYGLKVEGMRSRIAQITLGKLLGHPAALMLVMLLVPIADPQLRMAALLLAAMPMLGIYPLLAEKHGQQNLSAATLMVCTMLSFFSISALIWLMHHTALANLLAP